MILRAKPSCPSWIARAAAARAHAAVMDAVARLAVVRAEAAAEAAALAGRVAREAIAAASIAGALQERAQTHDSEQPAQPNSQAEVRQAA